jgi:hypothetical protein
VSLSSVITATVDVGNTDNLQKLPFHKQPLSVHFSVGPRHAKHTQVSFQRFSDSLHFTNMKAMLLTPSNAAKCFLSHAARSKQSPLQHKNAVI